MTAFNGNWHGPPVDELPSIIGAMQELRRHARSHWLDMARHDQSQRWRSGMRIFAEDYFTRIPELLEDREDSLVLICGEIQLRREAGEQPTAEEYQRRFPDLASDIKLQLDVEELLSQPGEYEAQFAISSESTNAQGTTLETGPDSELDLPGYEFLRRIGGGAFGSVFQARQVSLNRFVAIKVLANLDTDSKLQARQQQEAEILASLQHPNIVHIYEVVNRGGWLYLVMEYVDGPSLDETVAGKPLPPREAAQILYKLAETVEAVHRAGILHRDLKPSNVLLSKSGQLKISDFSLAKVRAGNPMLTVADDVLGTPSYMAPEQGRGEAHCVGPTADVYSLGAILYELLTGRPPFLGATVLDTLALVRTQDPVPPQQLQPKTPRDLQTICLKCLNKTPNARYQSAAQLCDDFLRYLNGQPILARPPGLLERTRRVVRRRPTVAILIAATIVLSAAAAVAKAYLDANERRSSAVALVDAISTADTHALPHLLRGVSERRELALPLLRERNRGAAAGDSAWVNLSIAQLAIDPLASPTPLLEFLPSAQPHDIGPIVNALQERHHEIVDALWQMLLGASASDEARLRLACLAAQCTPEDESWRAVAPAVCRSLVRQHPLDVPTYTALLQPARRQLVAALADQIESPNANAVECQSAISIAARFFTDEVELLVNLAVKSRPDEFSLLFPTLEAHRDAVLPKLKPAAVPVSIEPLIESNPTMPPRDIERAFDRSVRRNATAAIAGWRLGDREIVRNSLHGSDPSVRAWIIELLMPLGVAPEEIVQELEHATHPRYCQALVLALGQMAHDAARPTESAKVRACIVEIFRTNPDPGVHSACRWLLTRLGAADAIRQFESKVTNGPASNRGWFHGANSHLFSIVAIPASFRSGSPESEFWRETDEVPGEFQSPPTDYLIAVATHETTVEQFENFKMGAVNRQYSATPDSPMNNVSWYDAARYCRWLSEKEGTAEEEMVFPAIDSIGPDMKLPVNWLDRTGYRLPLEREFECACRAGTYTSRYCGAGRELLARYAWHLNCSDDHASPVGTLKPNGWGLFDMLGNVAERCHANPPAVVNTGESTSGPATDPTGFVPIGPQGTVRGGDFGDLNQNIRAARRAGVPANAEWATIGFRVVRTMPRPALPKK